MFFSFNKEAKVLQYYMLNTSNCIKHCQNRIQPKIGTFQLQELSDQRISNHISQFSLLCATDTFRFLPR